MCPVSCAPCAEKSRHHERGNDHLHWGRAMIQLHVERLRGVISAKLGRCPRCWRLSFRCAVFGWIAAGLAHFLIQDGRVEYVILAWPISFSILWLLHIVTFGLRVVAAERERHRLVAVERTVAAHPLQVSTPSSRFLTTTTSRRRMLQSFYRSAGWAVLVSAVIPLITACGGGGGNNVPRSCTPSFSPPPHTPNFPCPATCTPSCAPNTNTWFCIQVGQLCPGCAAGCVDNPSEDCLFCAGLRCTSCTFP